VKQLGLIRVVTGLRLLILGTALVGFMHACSGAEFKSDRQSQTSTGNNEADASTGGGAGGSASGNTNCLGPEDCDDGDPCTVEICMATGSCESHPTCGASERCCDGRCGECCEDLDCDDGVGCTVDRCFLGACIAMADDGACANAAVEMYCSLMGDCRAREPCPGNTPEECDDAEACTVDSCTSGLCSHDACAEGTVCCPDIGCGECCTNSQCDDGDPCTVDSCDSGTCNQVPLCTGEDQCCPDMAGTAASCGLCCTRDDCVDTIGCTVDACVQGQCSNVPASNLCPNGQVCTPMGCDQPQQCDDPADCSSANPCLSGSCDMGICHFSPCDESLLCCLDGCKECCGNPDCDDQNACTNDICEGGQCGHTNVDCERCNPELGCIECEGDAECDDNSACTSDSCDLQTYTCLNIGGACGTDQCCGAECRQCCSHNDCIAASEQQVIDPLLEPCAACGNDGKCSPLEYCDTTTQWCCNGQCTLIGVDCF